MGSIFYKIFSQSDEIKLDDWNKIIESRSDLKPIPDKVMTNPFTQENVNFAGLGKAYYMKGEEIDGNISLEEGALLARVYQKTFVVKLH